MKKTGAALLLVLVSSACLAEDQWGSDPVAGPGEMRASCADLDAFGGGKFDSDDVVFGVKKSEWTDQMVAFVTATASRCRTALRRDLYVRQRLTDQTDSQLFQRERQITAKARDIQKQNKAMLAQQEKDRREERRLQREEADRAEKARRESLATCEGTPEAKLYNAQEDVVGTVEQLAALRTDAARDRKVVQVSGVRDLYRERQNGETLVQLNEDLKANFSAYKKLGGKAASPQKVTHQLQDPCASFRPPAPQ